ncbi:2-polyprenyl-6-methoxyphenol hydroxylase-like FAD-dependent oxidoreductase [Nonomuraea muscovyensis]|uniref:2-polyprenyl-6-methoxyphenol hydroxylase-like FAD-dependent oxidoreductase n=1 Tax=Nonomuraea muscovyensis TaxID=1124761 RepID=A0A7X0BZS7_9ACTN|nr:FAD-dependent monooxygenase [Nonomuraea muscovyensis]MBB6345954.1 2-polyprenyl-6-methoxyphenol hydroxylase-like FAD-dependent oxidoreductase [Nonomuraea muscovyensis]
MKALIVGCGIGGPATAMALRNVGVDAEIFEAYPESAEGVGAFLNVASNGLDALRVLGAHRQVMAAGVPTPHMVMWSGTGKRLGQVANGLALDDGTVSHTILRSDLYRIVRDEALAQGVAITYGKRLVGFDDTGDQVVAHFEDGTQAAGDILVAADGVHSRTRALLDPGAPRPRYSGLYSLGGIVRNSGVTGTPGVYNMIFGKRAFFGYTVTHGGDAWWFANLPRELGDVPADWKAALLEAFADDAGPATELIRRGPVGDGLPVHDLPPLPAWHRGRVVLTGDAAHATSPSAGQGASLAIEDAIVLARCLRDASGHREAFERFEAERRGRVERVVAYSRTISNGKAAGPVARVFRDLALPFFLKKTASQESLAWMYRHHVAL